MGGSRDGHTILAEDFARHDLFVKVGLSLLHASRETLLLRFVNQALDFCPLALGRGLGLLLLGAHLSALIPPEVAAEVGLVSTLVVKVDNIACRES